ncbi:MAG: hypothetical protein M3145_06040 [Pseudomonadota bacterium]|nr:hypothetical protein [Pseudomonadota bacterium]
MATTSSHASTSLVTIGRVLVPFGLGYVLSYLDRTVNAVRPQAGGAIPAAAHVTVRAGIVCLEIAALLWLLAGWREAEPSRETP